MENITSDGGVTNNLKRKARAPTDKKDEIESLISRARRVFRVFSWG